MERRRGVFSRLPLNLHRVACTHGRRQRFSGGGQVRLEQVANATYGVLLSPTDGFQKKAMIDQEGVRNVLKLRSKYAEPKKTLGDPSRYYDDSYYREAMR